MRRWNSGEGLTIFHPDLWHKSFWLPRSASGLRKKEITPSCVTLIAVPMVRGIRRRNAQQKHVTASRFNRAKIIYVKLAGMFLLRGVVLRCFRVAEFLCATLYLTLCTPW